MGLEMVAVWIVAGVEMGLLARAEARPDATGPSFAAIDVDDEMGFNPSGFGVVEEGAAVVDADHGRGEDLRWGRWVGMAPDSSHGCRPNRRWWSTVLGAPMVHSNSYTCNMKIII
ncbi:hypothetical protein ACLOJK_023416 [Asimina triloba]